MHYAHKNRLAMFRRVRELLATQTENTATALPATELTGIITRLAEHGTLQDAHHRRMRSLTAALRDQARILRQDLMQPVVMAARSLGPKEEGDVAALRQAVRMPPGKLDYEALIVAARGMATAVESQSARFVAAGLPPDFVAQLRAGADALVSAVDARSQEVQRRMASTQGVAAEARRGTAVVRLLDALVRPGLRHDPARTAEWGKATRLARPALVVAASSVPVPAPTTEGTDVAPRVPEEAATRAA